MTPVRMSSRQLRMSSDWILVVMSFLSRSTPGTSVISTSFSALKAAAICRGRTRQRPCIAICVTYGVGAAHAGCWPIGPMHG